MDITNVQHSPMGAHASFTLGHPGPHGGLGLGLAGPAGQNVYIAVEEAPAAAPTAGCRSSPSTRTTSSPASRAARRAAPRHPPGR